MALELNGTTGVSLVQDGVVTAADLASTLDLTGKTVTLPSGTGGKVLQVVRSAGVNTALLTTTSSTYSEASTNFRTTITPSSTSSKILVQVMGQFKTTGGSFGAWRIYRSINGGAYGSVNAGNGNESFRNTGTTVIFTSGTLFVLDEPNTTQQCVYTLYFATTAGGGTVSMDDNSMGSFMIAMEIAA